MKKVFISVVVFLFLAVYAAPVFAAGPWKGKVIDVETKEPLEGAVVLAVWSRNYRTPTGGSTYFYEAKETLTDKDGGFEIPSYTPINVLPIISYIKKPEFIIFKPGYGKLQMSLGKYLTGKEVATQEFTLWGKSYRVSSGIVELPKLKTREERSMNIPTLPSWEYLEKEKLLIEKIHEEEENIFGLQKSDPYKAREFKRKMRK